MSNEIEQTYTKYDDDDDFIDDAFDATIDDSYLSHGSSEHAYAVPKRCRAIYDFKVCLNENLSVNLVTSLLKLLIHNFVFMWRHVFEGICFQCLLWVWSHWLVLVVSCCQNKTETGTRLYYFILTLQIFQLLVFPQCQQSHLFKLTFSLMIYDLH